MPTKIRHHIKKIPPYYIPSQITAAAQLMFVYHLVCKYQSHSLPMYIVASRYYLVVNSHSRLCKIVAYSEYTLSLLQFIFPSLTKVMCLNPFSLIPKFFVTSICAEAMGKSNTSNKSSTACFFPFFYVNFESSHGH